MSAPLIEPSSEKNVDWPGASGVMKLTVPDVLGPLMFVKYESGPP